MSDDVAYWFGVRGKEWTPEVRKYLTDIGTQQILLARLCEE